MYCPQCSQEQLSEEMRFCSRCGFPLAIVSQLVRNGGALAGFDAEAKGQLSPRQKGMRWGVILMFIGVLLVPVTALMSAVDEDFLVLFIPAFLIFVIGLVRLVHAYLLGQNDSEKRARKNQLVTWRVSAGFTSRSSHTSHKLASTSEYI
jgi:hypothetical protein